MEVAGVDRAVCLGVAPTPSRVEAANTFAAALASDRLVGLGSIHPGLSPEENLASLRRHRLPGVKIHPIYQGYHLDDPVLRETLSAMQGEFFAVVHVGLGDAGSERCTPAKFRDLALSVPGLELVACHFGGYLLLEEAEREVVGLPNVWLDTSWPPGLHRIAVADLRRIIARQGADRVVFASDWPMSDPRRDIETVRSIGLGNDETAAILGGNLAALIDRYTKS